MAGTLLTNLLLRTVHTYKQQNASSRGRSRGTEAELQAMDQLAYEARTLQRSLLTTMMGERLCRNFDWTLSALDAMEDDVTEWTQRLSVLEKKMFERGVEASGAVKSWREYGCSRMGVSLAVVKGKNMGRNSVITGLSPTDGNGAKRVVTPTGGETGQTF